MKKILAVSLLRLGDIIQQKPILIGLKNKWPGCEIHLLINKEFEHCANLFPEVSQFHFFDRSELQYLIGQVSTHLFRPLKELDAWIKSLQAQTFDGIYNLTHTRLSAYLIQKIPAPYKLGLVYESGKFQTFSNQALRYFNNYFSLRTPFFFHYSEILSYAMDLDFSWNPSPKKMGKRMFWIQASTNDMKKNWSYGYFRKLLDLLYKDFPETEIKILASPSEVEKMKVYFSEDEIACLSLKEIADRAREVDLLITGDTSIKHLLSMQGVPCLELALGSADPSRTGPLGASALILQSKAACYPCGHHSRCSQSTHVCADLISVDTVLNAVKALFDEKICVLKSDHIKVSESHWGPLGWSLRSVQNPLEHQLYLLEKATWLSYFGRSSVDFQLDLEVFAEAIAEQRILEETHITILQLIRNLIERFSLHDMEQFRSRLSHIVYQGGRIGSYLAVFYDFSTQPFSNVLHLIGEAQKRTVEFQRLVKIRGDIIRSTEKSISKGDHHESRTRQLPNSGVEAFGKGLSGNT